MNATPKTARVAAYRAQVARDEAARKARVATKTRLAYRSETGVVRPQRESKAPAFIEEDDPHCFVCGRHTDHFAEHDDMVEAGTARYGQNADGTFNGNVYPVPWGWDLG